MSVETSLDEWATGQSLLWWWIAFFIIFGCGFVLFDDKRYFWGTVNIVLGVWVGFSLGGLSQAITSPFLVADNSSVGVAKIFTTSGCIASLSGVVAHKFKERILGKIARLVVIFFLTLALVVIALVVGLLIFGISSLS